MSNIFDREIRLIGMPAFEKLTQSRVMLCGLGGVGGGALEALARAGIGELILVDKDVVDSTNLNRQLVALYDNVGIEKTEAAKKRVVSINPSTKVKTECVFIAKDNTQQLLEKYRPDYVIDAIDNVTAKIELAVRCYEMQIPLIASMGTGNKLNPTAFKVSDISKTTTCPLARVMRKELKERGIKKYKVVWSDEPPIKPTDGIHAPASISFVPPVAGMILAGEVIKDLTGIS